MNNTYLLTWHGSWPIGMADADDSLDRAIAAMPTGWKVLRDCAIGGAASPIRVRRVLLHPAVGIALLDVMPSFAPDAVACLRRTLDSAWVGAIFGGDLPIVYRLLPAGQFYCLSEILEHAFAAEPAPAFLGDNAWVEMVEWILTHPSASPPRMLLQGRPEAGARRLPGARRQRSLAPLLWSWGALLGAAGVAAGYLQYLGPPQEHIRSASQDSGDLFAAMMPVESPAIPPGLPSMHSPLDRDLAGASSEFQRAREAGLQVLASPSPSTGWESAWTFRLARGPGEGSSSPLRPAESALPNDVRLVLPQPVAAEAGEDALARPAAGGAGPRVVAVEAQEDAPARPAAGGAGPQPASAEIRGDAPSRPAAGGVEPQPPAAEAREDAAAGLAAGGAAPQAAPSRPASPTYDPEPPVAAGEGPNASRPEPQASDRGDRQVSSDPPAEVAATAPAPESESPPPGMGQPPAPPPSRQSAATSLVSPQGVGILLRRGDRMFELHDISAARLLYEGAARAGSGAAALKLGKTYDPHVLAGLQAKGAGADTAAASDWYRRAAELGEAEADQLLARLPPP